MFISFSLKNHKNYYSGLYIILSKPILKFEPLTKKKGGFWNCLGTNGVNHSDLLLHYSICYHGRCVTGAYITDWDQRSTITQALRFLVLPNFDICLSRSYADFLLILAKLIYVHILILFIWSMLPNCYKVGLTIGLMSSPIAQDCMGCGLSVLLGSFRSLEWHALTVSPLL